ncbi:uncharacterized protein [Mytilus edulis]|uniref:uncharacterized protein n=1 Tax=Mytilus edulis TaxID=6550 RepID=UPI0039F0C2A9
MANGSHVVPLGVLSLPIKLGDQVIHQEMIIADIEIPAVLGYDFMVKNKCVIDIANCTLKLNNQTIACELESPIPSLFRITIGQKVTIPPRSEMMVKANINEGETGKANLVIDSTAELLQDRGILVAKALYKGEQSELPIRVMNLSDSPQTLTKNSWAANAELLPEQNIMNETTHDESEGIPQFKEIYDRCKNVLTPEQTSTLKNLLHKNQKAFSMSIYDIGLTDIVQHKIDTNGARPVKHAPRRLPIAQRKEVEVEIKKNVG